MRTSRVVLTGLAVAGAAVTGSAFTAANPMPSGTVVGYGEVAVSGATVSGIDYNPAADNTNLAAVVFTVQTDITGQTATLTLKNGGSQVGASPYSCTETSAWNGTSMVLTCATTSFPFANFDAVGFTVRD